MTIDHQKVARVAMILVTAGSADLTQPGIVEEITTFNDEEWVRLVGYLSGLLKVMINDSSDPQGWRDKFAKMVYDARD